MCGSQERVALADHGLNTAYGQDHVMVCTGMIMEMELPAPRGKAEALAAVSSPAARDEASGGIRTWLRPGGVNACPVAVNALPGNKATMPQPTRADRH